LRCAPIICPDAANTWVMCGSWARERSAMPKQAADAGLPCRLGERGDRRVVQADQPLRVSGRVHRPGQGHLREHREGAVGGCGAGEQPQMGREVPGDITLGAVERRQQCPHTAMVPAPTPAAKPAGPPG
jgi:hypothetical protein